MVHAKCFESELILTNNFPVIKGVLFIMKISHLLHVFLLGVCVTGRDLKQVKPNRHADGDGHSSSTGTRKFIVEVESVRLISIHFISVSNLELEQSPWRSDSPAPGQIWKE